MKKFYGMFTIAMLLVTITVNAGPISGTAPATAGESEYYSPGIINPAEGTIELTALPRRAGAEFQNEWFFAFILTPGQPLKEGNNTLLGIFTPAGGGGFNGFSAVARIGNARYSADSKNKDFLQAGVPVNIALTWGPAGMMTYVNGKLYAKGNFPKDGVLSPMSASFKIGTDTPFNIQAARISTRQLPASGLSANPADSFKPADNTAFLWSKGKKPEYFVTDFSRKAGSFMLPEWSYADSMSPAGENAAITLAGLNLSSTPANYKVSITATTFEGAVAGTANQAIALPPAGEFFESRVALPVQSVGFYHLNITVTGPDGVDKKWKSSYMIYPANDTNVKDGKFAGYMGHHLSDNLEIAKELGIHWNRDWRFLWFNVEPKPGVFDWTLTDKAVAESEKNGVNILAILGNQPAWAAEDPKYKNIQHELAYMPARWKPRSVEEWSNYVYQIVSRYKGKVKCWEVWNEVDFHPPGAPASFSGSTKDYFELVKAVWIAAKKADPECKVLISGFSLMTVCDVNMPYDLIKMGVTDYIDYFNMHAYRGVLGVDELKKAVYAKAPGKPFWQTEQAWFQISDPRKQCELTAAIQLWFIEKGFDKFINFNLGFTNRFTRSPEAALQTLAVIQNQLRKCEEFNGVLPDGTVREFDIKHSFKRADGSYFTAIGKIDAKTTLKLSGDVISAQDMLGRELKITRAGDTATLSPTAIAYIVSKTPVKVVEAQSQIKSPCLNPGFEDFTGDNMGGLKGCIPNNWVLREKTYDKGGEIILDERARSGKYALKISASGQGRVYAFFETLGLASGKYTLSAWMKSANGKPAVANFSMFDVVGKDVQTKKIATVSDSVYTRYTAEFELKKRPEGPVMFIVGTGMDKEQSSILCDDVELVKQPLLRMDAVENIKIDHQRSEQKFKSGDKVIELEAMIDRVGGTQNIDGMMLEISRNPVVLSTSSEWSGITARTFRKLISGSFTKMAFLVCSMYVPAKENSLIGSIIISYNDGSSETFKLENNKNIRDWYLAATPGGINPIIKFSDAGLSEFGLFLAVWNNPFPQKEITAFEVKAETSGLLCLAAVAAEKK